MITAQPKYETDRHITPRSVADKSVINNLHTAITFALDVESEAIQHNTRTFNINRYATISTIEDYEELKNRARAIKEESIEKLSELIEKLKKAITSRGGYFYLAKTGEEASKYITTVCKAHNAKLVVKAKSITSEEIHLNKYLEEENIEVAETDLAEFILQVSDEQPSHIVAPAIHRNRERISKLFRESFDTDAPLETGEDLTKFARDILRKKFITADIGITGANVIAADTGTLLLVESEGNIRMVTHAPPVHIALSGIEKIVSTVEDIHPFLELLAPSATGQPLTSYTHIISPPLDVPTFSFDGRGKKPREFHLVLIDNGRMKMRDDSILKEALYCIRCSACLNSCANFQVLGGHAFGGETYSGGIGGSWEVGTGTLPKATFSDLCSGCSRCVPNCPVKIDIPWLNENLRYRLNNTSSPSVYSYVTQGFFPIEEQEKKSPLGKIFFSNYQRIMKLGSLLPFVANRISGLQITKIFVEKLFGIDRRRNLPTISAVPFTVAYAVFRKKNKTSNKSFSSKKALLYADSFTNYTSPHIGAAAATVLQSLGIAIEVSDVQSEGRDSLSQGLIPTTKKRAGKVSQYLSKYLNIGYDIIVIEPSILALFRRDYRHFINADDFERLSKNSYEVLEYLYTILSVTSVNLSALFNLQEIKNYPKIFYHSHCQQKTINADQATIQLLRLLGFDVEISSVECCGMAGSFGYKKEYYDVSMRVGNNLLEQINTATTQSSSVMLSASGVSCSEQIKALTGKEVIHPVELIAKFIIADRC